MPTVQREGGSYLLKTIDSLIRHTSDKEKMEVVVVILLADLDPNIRGQMTLVLETAYRTYIADGFIQIVTIRTDFYPPLRHLDRTFGDSDTRVRWRSKQAVDFAFLMLYCSNISEYYMQLEDDVISTPNFLTSMREFIVRQAQPWVCLEFSHMGFIGKFYRSRHLRKLGMFMRNFYSEQPVDFLFRYFNVLMTQKTTIMRTPSLFHHIGTVSSLPEKNMGRRSLEDIQDALPKVHKGDNPAADISTTLKTFKAYTIDLPYQPTAGHFWGMAPTGGEAVFVAFQEPVRLKRVIVETGSKSHKDDFLRYGKLEASPRMISRLEDGRVLCTEYIYLGVFENGRIEVDDIEKRIPYEVHCLKITVTQRQASWLLIREVAVFDVNHSGNRTNH